jgi:hypothetical protein
MTECKCDVLESDENFRVGCLPRVLSSTGRERFQREAGVVTFGL